MTALIPWYNGVQGALGPWTDDDSANLSHLLLQSDPYRQQSFMNVRDLRQAWNSPFGVLNPRTNVLFQMTPNSAWDEEYRQTHRGYGWGLPQSPNMYGGDYGLSFGGGDYWGVPHHLGGHEGFHDYYTDPW